MSTMPSPAPVSELAARVREIRDRIDRAARRAGRSTNDVRLVAVTKTFDADVVRAACSLGLSEFGENYVQEAVKKISLLAGEGSRARWHLIGHLQANKVKIVMGKFEWIHSVDRISLLEALAGAGRSGERVPDLLLQVNLEEDRTCFGMRPSWPLSKDASTGVCPDPRIRSAKFGFEPAALADALRAAAEMRLPVKGLMTFPPYFEDPEKARPYYAKLRGLRDELSRGDWGETIAVRELSMGMSNDFETAIEEGATLVRVGASLFGPRRGKEKQ